MYPLNFPPHTGTLRSIFCCSPKVENQVRWALSRKEPALKDHPNQTSHCSFASPCAFFHGATMAIPSAFAAIQHASPHWNQRRKRGVGICVIIIANTAAMVPITIRAVGFWICMSSSASAPTPSALHTETAGQAFHHASGSFGIVGWRASRLRWRKISSLSCISRSVKVILIRYPSLTEHSFTPFSASVTFTSIRRPSCSTMSIGLLCSSRRRNFW